MSFHGGAWWFNPITTAVNLVINLGSGTAGSGETPAENAARVRRINAYMYHQSQGYWNPGDGVLQPSEVYLTVLAGRADYSAFCEKNPKDPRCRNYTK